MWSIQFHNSFTHVSCNIYLALTTVLLEMWSSWSSLLGVLRGNIVLKIIFFVLASHHIYTYKILAPLLCGILF